MFSCFIRYTIDPERKAEFREYASTWIRLIEKYGGTHHGYFIPGDADAAFPEATFSFPGLGTEGPSNIAVAVFSFKTLEAYESYRKNVLSDEACKAITAAFHKTPCFRSYERTFLTPILSPFCHAERDLLH